MVNWKQIKNILQSYSIVLCMSDLTQANLVLIITGRSD